MRRKLIGLILSAAALVAVTSFAPTLSSASPVIICNGNVCIDNKGGQYPWNSANNTMMGSPVTTTNSSTAPTAPVVSTVQNNTDLQTSVDGRTGKSFRSTGTAPIHRLGVGAETTFSEQSQVYSIPLTYYATPDLYFSLVTPIVNQKNSNNKNELGFGDIALSGKYLLGDEEKIVESHTLLTFKFPTGDADRNTGTGSYDIAITEKLIKRFANYRFTVMGGLVQPLNDPTIKGYSVNYGTQMSYMLAAETNQFAPNLWFGLRMSGINNLNNTVDGIRVNDDITTVDLTPEIKYYTSNNTALNFAVVVPVHTRYDVPNAKHRDVQVNFGVFRNF